MPQVFLQPKFKSILKSKELAKIQICGKDIQAATGTEVNSILRQEAGTP